MIEAYTLLHQDGYAHSVEVWKANELVGGIYGILLGEVFFGESMFSKISNASKFGFISLVQKLKEMGIKIIDCQQETKHLASLGAENISREEFMKYILQNHNNQEFRQII
jgi:leucyl/phenylalanyl-tRNA--protein transferase